jgi:hypothetical protein
MALKSTSDHYGIRRIDPLVKHRSDYDLIGVPAYSSKVARYAVFLILIASGFGPANAVDPIAKATILRVHVPIAVGVLALMILRIVWWWGFDRKPTAVAGSPRWQERTAQVVHVLFYIIILGMSERPRNDGAERRSATDLWRRERPTAGFLEVPSRMCRSLSSFRSPRRSALAHVVQ